MALNIPNQLFNPAPVTVTGYRSHESGQVENNIVHSETLDSDNGITTITTVTTGKTLYLSNIFVRGGVGNISLYTGAAGSEVRWFKYTSNVDTKTFDFTTPIKFASETRIAWTQSSSTGGSDTTINLIGWEE